MKLRRALSVVAVAAVAAPAATDQGMVWLDAAGHPTSTARQALTLIEQSRDDGLDPADYRYDELTRLANKIGGSSTQAEDRARFDAVLTAAMTRLFRDVHDGRVDPRAIGVQLNPPAGRRDFAAELREAVTSRRLVEKVNDLRPPLAQYRLLQQALARYRTLAVGDADDRVVGPPVNAVCRPGGSCKWAGWLGQHLAKLGDLSTSEQASTDPARYEGPVVQGVKRFQTRHGLKADGVLGQATIEALRVPMRWRVRQIELALERLRWLPHVGDERLLVVNIPMFQLWAWDRTPPRTTPQFSMNVVVGRALGAQTPVLAALMREVIFRPYWNVPRSIVVREILPALSRDPGYLERHDMEIVRGDGDRAVVERTGDATNGLRRGTLQVRQRPGPQNSLGLIKFEFPNAESIYMHGTPAHALFGRPRRDFSHGCIRVEDPVRLAQWVLNDDVRWNRERIVGATMDSSSMRVAVPQPIQVILFYTTAAVMPDDGSVHFASDIYGQDAGLDRAVARRVVSE